MATYSWKSGVSGSWNDAALWTPDGGPVVVPPDSPFAGTTYSKDAVLFDTGAAGSYTVTGAAKAISLTVMRDSVVFDNFTFGNDAGNSLSAPIPTMTVGDGANVVVGSGGKISTFETVSFPYGSYGKLTINNAAMTVLGAVTATLDVQDKGVLTVAGTGSVTSPVTNHTPIPQAAVEQGGTVNVAAGATFFAPLAHLAGTINLDGSTAEGGTIDATGVFNGSNGAVLAGLGYLYLGNISNAGVIAATAGTFTVQSGSVVGAGIMSIATGATLSLTGLAGSDAITSTNTVAFNPGATLELSLHARISGLLTSFGKGDAVDLANAAVTNIAASDANGVTTVTAYAAGAVLNSFQLTGDYSPGDFSLAGDGAGGSVISYVDHTPAPPAIPAPPTPTDPAPTPAPVESTPPATVNFQTTDTSSGESATAAGEAYVGPVAGVTIDYICVTQDNMAVAAAVPSVFIHTGGGTDAITVLSGRNVVDGGTGSNFLTAGSGTDTFFVDARNAPSDTWSTVLGAHSGDDVTVFGITPQDFAISFADNQGAAGATGLTMHAASAGNPTASFTLAGFGTADLASGKVAVAYGANGNEAYMNVRIV